MARRRKELKEVERAFIVGMAKGGASISKIAQETKRPRGTVATVLINFQLREMSKQPNVLEGHQRQHREMTGVFKNWSRMIGWHRPQSLLENGVK